jgi:cytochrome c5
MKFFKYFSTLVYLSFIGCFFYACTAYDLASEAPTEIPINASNPTWDTGVQTIIAKRCDNCHAKVQSKFVPGHVKPYNFGLSSSEEEFAKHLSGTRLWVFNKPENPMPPNYSDQLYPNEKEALKNYVNAKLAAKEVNLSLCDSINLDETTLNFQTHIKPIVDVSCKYCHSQSSNGAAGGGRVVETVEQYRQYRNSVIEYMSNVHSGTYSAMPPAGGLAQSSKEKILEWSCLSSEAK